VRAVVAVDAAVPRDAPPRVVAVRPGAAGRPHGQSDAGVATIAPRPVAGDARAATRAALARLGYRGFTMQGDPAENVAELRAQIAEAASDEDRNHAISLEVALGNVQRRQGDCGAALDSFARARDDAQRFYDHLGKIGRAADPAYRVWERRAVFATALCKLELGAPDAMKWLDAAEASGYADHVETLLGKGLALYDAGAIAEAKQWIRYAYDRRDPATLRLIEEWAHAVGVTSLDP
jgi:hypothetical protein